MQEEQHAHRTGPGGRSPGNLITFKALGDMAQLDRVFAKYANAATDAISESRSV